jgi:hypothetical protein
VLSSEFVKKNKTYDRKKATVFDNSVGEWTTVDKLATGIEIQTLFPLERGQVKDLVQQNPSPWSQYHAATWNRQPGEAKAPVNQQASK